MGRAKAALYRLARIKFKKIKPIAKTAAIGAVGGAYAGYVGGQPGLRGEAAREGALMGGLATGLGHVVFRKIRGRIIPIRVKK